MIIRKEVNVPAKYFLNPISPEGADYFPSKEGFISCRQATFQTVTYMRISVKTFSHRVRFRLSVTPFWGRYGVASVANLQRTYSEGRENLPRGEKNDCFEEKNKKNYQ